MTKEQIDVLEHLLNLRRELHEFIYCCGSNICRIVLGDGWSKREGFSFKDVKMVNLGDFKDDVIALAEKYIASVEEQIEKTITEVK